MIPGMNEKQIAYLVCFEHADNSFDHLDQLLGWYYIDHLHPVTYAMKITAARVALSALVLAGYQSVRRSTSSGKGFRSSRFLRYGCCAESFC
jgi:hypothetical protein